MATPTATIFGTYREGTPEWLQSSLPDGRVIQPGGIYLDLATFNVAPFTQADGRVEVPSGTPIYRTIANRNAGVGYSPLLDADATIILAGNIYDFQIGINYGHLWDLNDETNSAMIQALAGNQILENFLPNQATVTAGVRSVLRNAGFVLLIGRE